MSKWVLECTCESGCREADVSFIIVADLLSLQYGNNAPEYDGFGEQFCKPQYLLLLDFRPNSMPSPSVSGKQAVKRDNHPAPFTVQRYRNIEIQTTMPD